MLALLAVVAVVLFTAVTGLSRIYHAQQASLGNRWFNRGVTDLEAKRYDRAVIEFRAALVYSRDDYVYQLNLAEALVGEKRTPEAYAYLINLWDREPENGVVNLELARISAERGLTNQALRYFHNAIYATWPGDQEIQRRDTRLELINYLLKINSKPQAESELIALAANLGNDPVQQQNLGDLFLRAQDYERALAAFRTTLRADSHNQQAMAGAGLAAFALGRYDLAQHYLQEAVNSDHNDTQSAERLKLTQLVLQLDPFRRGLSATDRTRIVIDDFGTAGDRLKVCGGTNGYSLGTGSPTSLSETWTKMKPQITPWGIRRDPDLVESAMDLVFNIERQDSTTCGTPTGKDEALLLIAKLHEGS